MRGTVSSDCRTVVQLGKMAQSLHWLLILRLETSELWELTNSTLPPALARPLGPTQLYSSNRAASWVVVGVLTVSVLQHKSAPEELEVGQGPASHLLRPLISNQWA